MVCIIVFGDIMNVGMFKLGSDNIRTNRAFFCFGLGCGAVRGMTRDRVGLGASIVTANMPVTGSILLPCSAEVMLFCLRCHRSAIRTGNRRATVVIIGSGSMCSLCRCRDLSAVLAGDRRGAVTVVRIRSVACLACGNYRSAVLAGDRRGAVAIVGIRGVICLACGNYRSAVLAGDCRGAVAIVSIRSVARFA